MEEFLKISGVVLWVLILGLGTYKLIYGKEWLIKLGLHSLSLNKFNNSLTKLYSQLPNKIQKETVAEVTGTFIWRITRIGLLALVISVIPILLLFRQNQLIKSQNTLFGEQNKMITAQSQLFQDQNILIKNQLRPYIDISSNPNDISVTLLNVINAPAFIDSLIIEYYVKEFGKSEDFVLLDRQIDKRFSLYPTKNQTSRRIKTNILTKEFRDKLKIKNRRLKRVTKIFYSNLKDEIGREYINGNYKSERIDFLSKKNYTWYLREQIE